MREFILWKSWHVCNLLLVKNMDMVLFLYTISSQGGCRFRKIREISGKSIPSGELLEKFAPFLQFQGNVKEI